MDFLGSTIDKFNSYREKLLSEDPDNEYLKAITYEALEKLHQINFLFKKQQQIEYCFLKGVMEYFLHREGFTDINIEEQNVKDHIPKPLFKDEVEYFCTRYNKNNEVALREIVIYTESIYYFAFSFQKKCDKIPGLKQFTCNGIRNVRNHIMEHPKVNFSNDFSITTNSVILKTGKYTYSKLERKWIHEDISLDSGLKANLEEFKTKLENLIDLRLEGK